MIAICRAIAAALVVSCLVATAVRAEQMSERLRALLEHVPKALLQAEGGAGPFHFVDHVTAARAVSHAGPGAGDLWRNPEAPLMRALSPSLRNSYGPGRDGGWEAFGGFRPLDLRQTVEIGPPGRMIMVLAMAPGVTDAMGDALATQDYALRTGLPHPVWWRGEDNMIDLSARNPANPFGGAMGRASRVALIGDVVVQGPEWLPVMAVVAGVRPSVMDDPDMQTLAEGIDAAPPMGGVLVQALVTLVPADLAPTGDGALPWSGAAILDVSTPEAEIGALVLALPDAQTAEAVARYVEIAWASAPTAHGGARTMADVTGVMPHFTVVGVEPAALVMTLSAPFDTSRGVSPNRSFEALLTAFVMRDMVFLPTP